MSLFIGSLAVPAEAYDVDIRIAVLIASLASALCGYLVLPSTSAAAQPKSTVTTS
jgi:Na+/H+ antiporter NhaA